MEEAGGRISYSSCLEYDANDYNVFSQLTDVPLKDLRRLLALDSLCLKHLLDSRTNDDFNVGEAGKYAFLAQELCELKRNRVTL